jgi:hypothetical protein
MMSDYWWKLKANIKFVTVCGYSIAGSSGTVWVDILVLLISSYVLWLIDYEAFVLCVVLEQ